MDQIKTVSSIETITQKECAFNNGSVKPFWFRARFRA